MSILSVCDIECCGATIHLAREKREVHVVRGHEERLVTGDEVTNEGSKLVELIFGKCLTLESHRVVGLRAGASQGKGVVPALVGAVNQDVKMVCAIRSKSFGRWYEQRDVPNDSCLVSVLSVLTSPIEYIVTK